RHPRAHGRPSVPLRHLSPRHAGDQARFHQNGGRDAMTIHPDSIIPEFDLSRRNALKAGGALIVGFSLGGAVSDGAAARGEIAGPPDPSAVDTWIAIHPDNTATIYCGTCELGQG